MVTAKTMPWHSRKKEEETAMPKIVDRQEATHSKYSLASKILVLDLSKCIKTNLRQEFWDRGSIIQGPGTIQ